MSSITVASAESDKHDEHLRVVNANLQGKSFEGVEYSYSYLMSYLGILHFLNYNSLLFSRFDLDLQDCLSSSLSIIAVLLRVASTELANQDSLDVDDAVAIEAFSYFKFQE